MMVEVRQAMLLQRVEFGVGFRPDAMTARQALEVATLGGTRVLNRDDIGALKTGMSADIVMFDVRQIGFAGALHDPVVALVFCTPPNVACSIINGRVVIRDGQITTLDLGQVIERHNRLAVELAEAAH
jgi:8-oxoguanine deaminase